VCKPYLLAPISLLLVSCLLAPALTPTPAGALPPTQTPAASGAGSCTITVANNPATVYNRPSASADQFGMLQVGETAEPTAKTADSFYGFEPGVAQAGNIGIFRLRWILKTHDVSTTGGCASIPTVVGPISGICYAMIGSDSSIYTSASASSAQIATYHSGDYAMITAHAAGWFTLDLNVGSPSMDDIGYLKESDLGGLNGPCDSF
jgi:hypothetical protein